MAAVRHLELEFSNFGPPHEVIHVVRLSCQNFVSIRSPRRRYCDFMILPVRLENAFLGFFGG